MLEKQIAEDFVQALKSKDENATSVLRMLKSALQNKKIEKKLEKDQPLPEEDIIAVIKSEVKKRNDSVTSYQEAGRDDLVEKEKSEIEILNKYLPEQMSEDAVREVVKKVIADTGAESAADFGKVMGQVMARAKGQADGQIVSSLVKEELSK